MTPRAFLDEVVKPNVADFHACYGEPRWAFNAVAAVDALAAHIFVWLQNNSPSSVGGLNDSSYRAKLADAHEEFRVLRDIAKAQKHVLLTQGAPAVGVLPKSQAGGSPMARVPMACVMVGRHRPS